MFKPKSMPGLVLYPRNLSNRGLHCLASVGEAAPNPVQTWCPREERCGNWGWSKIFTRNHLIADYCFYLRLWGCHSLFFFCIGKWSLLLFTDINNQWPMIANFCVLLLFLVLLMVCVLLLFIFIFSIFGMWVRDYLSSRTVRDGEMGTHTYTYTYTHKHLKTDKWYSHSRKLFTQSLNKTGSWKLPQWLRAWAQRTQVQFPALTWQFITKIPGIWNLLLTSLGIMHRHTYMQAIHHTHKINLKTIIIKTYTYPIAQQS